MTCPPDPSNPELEVVCRAAEAAERAATAAEALAARGTSLAAWGDFVQALALAVVPIAAVVFAWRLYGPIRRIVEGRAFTIKVGPFELSAQEAAEQIAKQVEDLQRKVVGMEAAMRAAGGPAAAAPRRAGPTAAAPAPDDWDAFAEPALPAPPASASGPPHAPARRKLRVLWVDDRPQNNAFEIASLYEDGHAVVTARSTAEALALLAKGQVDLVVSDISRPEGREAGMDMLREMRAAGDQRPFGFYTTASGLARNAPAMAGLQPFVATDSFVDLMAAIRALPRDGAA